MKFAKRIKALAVFERPPSQSQAPTKKYDQLPNQTPQPQSGALLVSLAHDIIHEWSPTNKLLNNCVHALNGNIRNNGFKICQWNCGNAYLENKLVEIEAAIACHKPKIMCISESNPRL